MWPSGVALSSLEREMNEVLSHLRVGVWVSLHPLSPSRPQYWFVAVPHAVLIWVYDEVRKLFIRLFPGSEY